MTISRISKPHTTAGLPHFIPREMRAHFHEFLDEHVADGCFPSLAFAFDYYHARKFSDFRFLALFVVESLPFSAPAVRPPHISFHAPEKLKIDSE